MPKKNTLFARFPAEREKKLRSILRYSMFEVMFYRPSVWIHAQRVLWIVEELAPIARRYFKNLDGEKARILALVHDDAEIITGDVQAGHKARMSKKELALAHKKEQEAIRNLAKRYPITMGGYSYKELLTEALYKDTPHASSEARLVTYADRLDGLCESFHEVLAGNLLFLRSLIFYVKKLQQIAERPGFRDFCLCKESPFINLTARGNIHFVKRKYYAVLGKPHTRRSIQFPTDFPFYNRWRKLNRLHGILITSRLE